MRGVFWMVSRVTRSETIHARYLFLTRKGRKQKLTLSYLHSEVNLKIQTITSGVQPRLKK